MQACSAEFPKINTSFSLKKKQQQNTHSYAFQAPSQRLGQQVWKQRGSQKSRELNKRKRNEKALARVVRITTLKMKSITTSVYRFILELASKYKVMRGLWVAGVIRLPGKVYTTRTRCHFKASSNASLSQIDILPRPFTCHLDAKATLWHQAKMRREMMQLQYKFLCNSFFHDKEALSGRSGLSRVYQSELWPRGLQCKSCIKPPTIKLFVSLSTYTLCSNLNKCQTYRRLALRLYSSYTDSVF